MNKVQYQSEPSSVAAVLAVSSRLGKTVAQVGKDVALTGRLRLMLKPGQTERRGAVTVVMSE